MSSKKETKTYNTTPEHIQQDSTWSSGALKEALQKQQSGSNPYPELTNPYADWSEKAGMQGLMSSEAGQQYLQNYTKPVENSIRNSFGANGLYGSVGSGMMSGAMGSGLSQAQNQAVQAWNNDLLMSIMPQEWQNQYLTDKWNASGTQDQQYINNLLQLYGIATPTTASGQVVEQSEKKSPWQSIAGIGGALLGGFLSNPAYKEEIRAAEPVLDKVMQLDIPTWQYKGEDVRHIGPMADQWAALFGGDGEQISIQDAIGVTLKAVQEINHKLNKLIEVQSDERR